MDFRFAVGKPDGLQSNGWKLWGQGENAYLLQRAMGNVQKFSFHKSGICRWAKKDERARSAWLRWERDPVPEAGSGQACRLVSLAFPTNHLSARGEGVDNVYWIKPALPRHAAVVEISLTREDRATIQDFFQERGERKLVFCQTLRNVTNLCAAVLYFDCGPVDLRIPAEPVRPGQVFEDLTFPDHDTESTGRPVRMYMAASHSFPPVVWELGGYELTKTSGRPCPRQGLEVEQGK